MLQSGCSGPTAESDSNEDSLRNIAYAPIGALSLGQLDSVKYSNDYFGFSILLPDSTWYILDEEQYEQRLDETGELLSTEAEALEKTKANVANLFTIRKNLQADGTGQLQSISFMSEGLDKLPGVNNAIEYVYWTDNFVKENLTSNFPKYAAQGIDTAYIGSRVFLHTTWEITAADGVVYYQENYCAMFDKFLLNVLVNYQTQDEADENQQYLSKIHWN